jgi:hypothetical protein
MYLRAATLTGRDACGWNYFCTCSNPVLTFKWLRSLMMLSSFSLNLQCREGKQG